MTRNQAVKARALLGWSPQHLAQVSGVPFDAVLTLERIGSAELEHTQRIRATLVAAGIDFLDNGTGSRVKLRKADT